ncbi:MAG: aspartate--tRNA ligase [Lentisphaerae bacterium]|nr:aspartate--tRNA ligase [Lentisphaerota bacterium]MBT4819447.1 aspartate--tRNA ligase [Lentisphaerota bacterium]MBT5610207.1 aspartate--tRNA ligase [Lentisphaerota bacterium]MBT7060027.1 aspartate--tRNA ligase [Lentisphaerota bacterium]MBT7840643.1 aspartate--tRNA ligase [Lentisphaerota bacterium]
MKTHPFRTHKCGDLRSSDIGSDVRLSGWVHSVRDHGGIIFVDLRDESGITQIVIHPDREFYQAMDHWRLESVLCFAGSVIARSEDTVNPKLATGDIEISAESMDVLSEADVLPFQVASDQTCDENLRLKYRFLDLRRASMQRNILMRSQVTASARRRMTEMGFTEFQTPILTCSSPEGARDFLVPSRLHAGTFYALPQAPQIYKQLFMVSGFDRYFQIAPCFRDEDSRADRSPGEFYQIDIEMAFATQDDVFAVVEPLIHGIFTEFGDQDVTDTPFPRIAYRDAMLKYGSDKPDLRIPIEIVDVSEQFGGSDFNAFAAVVKKGGVVRALPVRGIASAPRSFFDNMIAFTQSCGGKGLGYITWTEDGVKSPIAKFISEERIEQLRAIGDMRPGDVMFFVADKKRTAETLAGQVRTQLADILELREQGTFRFCWIVDYPMFEWNEEHRRVDFSHNPFSMPQGGLEALNGQDPLDVLAYQYDLVCNGVELSSGAIRNHRPDIMARAFEIAGYSQEELATKFGGLLRAFHFGAPPHGGIAPGLDRIIMLLTGEPNIRQIIAFPLNQRAQDPLLGAPNEVDEKDLRELHIRVRKPRPTMGKDGQTSHA